MYYYVLYSRQSGQARGGARRTIIIIMKELAMDGLGMRGEGLISMTIGGEVWVKLLLFFLRGGR